MCSNKILSVKVIPLFSPLRKQRGGSYVILHNPETTEVLSPHPTLKEEKGRFVTYETECKLVDDALLSVVLVIIQSVHSLVRVEETALMGDACMP